MKEPGICPGIYYTNDLVISLGCRLYGPSPTCNRFSRYSDALGCQGTTFMRANQHSSSLKIVLHLTTELKYDMKRVHLIHVHDISKYYYVIYPPLLVYYSYLSRMKPRQMLALTRNNSKSGINNYQNIKSYIIDTLLFIEYVYSWSLARNYTQRSYHDLWS